MAGGRKGLYGEWLKPDALLRLEGWARDGLNDEQIAKNIGIRASTLYEWQNRFPEIAESIKRGKAPVDQEVENTLLKTALGFEYEETITEIIETPEGGHRKQVRKIKHYSPPNTTAQIFWLKNRRPDRWRDRQDINGNLSIANAGNAMKEAFEEMQKRVENDERGDG